MAVPVSCAASSSFSSRDAMPIAKVPSIVPVMPEVESEVCRSMLAFGFTALYASISFSITGDTEEEPPTAIWPEEPSEVKAAALSSTAMYLLSVTTA